MSLCRLFFGFRRRLSLRECRRLFVYDIKKTVRIVGVWNKSSINVLPVSVLGVRTGGELNLLVSAFEGDVEPSKESMDI